MTTTPGLRERKKDATRRALHEAAVRLALEHGLERVTVEAIADAADVSRRTFSNYFAGKEEAIFHSDELRLQRLLALVAARPASESAWTALSRAAEDLVAVGVRGTVDVGTAAQIRLLRSHPSLARHQAAAYAATERALAEAVLPRLDPAPPGSSVPEVDRLRARLLAAALLTSLRVTFSHWMDHPGTDLTEVLRAGLAVGARAGGRIDGPDGDEPAPGARPEPGA